jgi:hypothetical protein
MALSLHLQFLWRRECCEPSPIFPSGNSTNGQIESQLRLAPTPHQRQPCWAPAVHDSRLPLRLLLIVLNTLNVAPANEPLAVISIPNCSNILCEELIQIVRISRTRVFNGVIAPAFLTTTLCFFP